MFHLHNRGCKRTIGLRLSNALPALLLLTLNSKCGVLPGAEPNQVPVQVLDGGFVREWPVLGPFPSDDLGTDFLAESGGEANVRPQEGVAVAGRNGRKLVWKRYRSNEDYLMLEQNKYFQSGFDNVMPKPFRVEQLCECLMKTLAVQFDYADTERISTNPCDTQQLRKVIIPPELLQQLKRGRILHHH